MVIWLFTPIDCGLQHFRAVGFSHHDNSSSPHDVCVSSRR